MNNAKKLYLLGAALVAVLVLIFIINAIGNVKPSAKERAFFPGFNASTCSAFQIADTKDTVKIFRKGESWLVTRVTKAGQKAKEGVAAGNFGKPETAPAASPAPTFPCDSAEVATALAKIQGMQKDILVSQNPQKQETFEVDSAKGLLVEAFDEQGKSLGVVRIGKWAPGNSNYVKAVGSEDVYSVGNSPKFAFFTDVKRWRDKTITKFDPLQVKRFAIARYDSGDVKMAVRTFERSAPDSTRLNKWSLVGSQKPAANRDDIEWMVKVISQLTAADWVNDSTIADSITGFDNPTRVATFTFVNGDSIKYTVGKKQPTGGMVYLKTDRKKDIFFIYDSNASYFDKKLEDQKVDVAASSAQQLKAKDKKKSDKGKPAAKK